MIINKIQGLIAATFTPFDAEGNLNLSMVPVMAETLAANSIKGAFINGTTGEGPSLTFDEKTKQMAAWAPFVSDEFLVLAMLGGTSQKEACLLAKKAVEMGLSGVAVTAPYYFKPASVDRLVAYLKPIAESAAGLPLYFYHIPLLTGVDLPMMELLSTVDGVIPNFAGIKYTHHNLMEFNQCLRYKNKKFDVLWGWDETFLAGLSMGAKGAVGSTYNFAAPLYHRIIKAVEDNDLETARKLQEKSVDFIALYGKFGGAAAGKSIMKLCGLDCGAFRVPVAKLTTKEENALRQELEKQGFFEFVIKRSIH